MADSTSGNLELPVFEAGKTYLLKGETLKQITDVIRENKVVLTGTKQWEEVGPDGSKINLDATDTGTGTVTVTTGDTSGGVEVSTLSGVTTITFDQDLFTISDGTNGVCFVDLQTEDCA